MAINRPRHIPAKSLDVLLDGRGLVIGAYVGAQGLQARMMLGGGYGDNVGGGVEQVRLLDGVHACIRGGTIDEEL